MTKPTNLEIANAANHYARSMIAKGTSNLLFNKYDLDKQKALRTALDDLRSIMIESYKNDLQEIESEMQKLTYKYGSSAYSLFSTPEENAKIDNLQMHSIYRRQVVFDFLRGTNKIIQSYKNAVKNVDEKIADPNYSIASKKHN